MIRDLARGARAALSGVAFVVKTPRAWGWALLPAAIAMALALGLTALGAWGLYAGIRATVPSGEVGSILQMVLFVAGIAVVAFVAVVIALAVAQPIARVALERLARSLEDHVGARQGGTMPSSSLVQSIGTAAAALGISLPAIGALEGITLVVPESAFVTEPLAFAVAALALAWDLLDHPFSRRGLGAGARLRWMRANAALVVGFALVSQALLLVPGLDLFFLPMGIVGATRLLAEADARDRDHAHGSNAPRV